MKLWIAIVVLMFATVGHAGALFPEGTYKKNEYTLRIKAD